MPESATPVRSRQRTAASCSAVSGSVARTSSYTGTVWKRSRASSGRNAFAASTTFAAGTVPDAVCTRTRPPSTVTSSTRVPSAICTPNDSAARASPHASRAGSTRAQPSRSTRPARYVGGLAQEQWQDTVFRTR